MTQPASIEEIRSSVVELARLIAWMASGAVHQLGTTQVKQIIKETDRVISRLDSEA